MRFCFIYYLTVILWQLAQAVSHNIICYYDASSTDRKGVGQFTLGDLESSLEFCSHLIYGYVGINPLTYRITSLDVERDVGRAHFRQVTSLKLKYPHIKILLSVGGGRDLVLNMSNKYLQLLEADPETQNNFIDSALYLMRSNKFDGLDLAFQFPAAVHKAKSTSWNTLKKLFEKKVNQTEYKEKNYSLAFSRFLETLNKAFKPFNFMLTLSVLPNINASLYFSVPAIDETLDFVTLQTFDFITPEKTPNEASYTAPLFSVPQRGGSDAEQTVDYQVNYWLAQHMPASKLNIGIAAYGRAWLLTRDSSKNGYPKILGANGPAPASYVTNSPGILTWTEICPLLLNAFNVNKTGSSGPLISVLDPYKDFVTYAFRPADANGQHGIWISYDDPRIAAIKAAYVKNRHLAGVAIFDVGLDDFHGICNGDTFPMLRYIKYTFS